MTLDEILSSFERTLISCLVSGLENENFQELHLLINLIDEVNPKNKALDALLDKSRALVGVDSDKRISSWLELNGLVQKIKRALIKNNCSEGEKENRLVSQERVEFREIRYSEVKYLIKALKEKSPGRLSLLRESIAMETFKCRQLLPYFIDTIVDRNSDAANLVVKEVLPYYGRLAIPLLLKQLSYKSGVGQFRLIQALFNFMSLEEKRDICSILLKNSDTETKKFVVKNADFDLSNLPEIAPLRQSRSKELRDLVAQVFEKNA